MKNHIFSFLGGVCLTRFCINGPKSYQMMWSINTNHEIENLWGLPHFKKFHKARPKNGQKRPKMTLFYNKHIIRWAKNLKKIIIFLMATHPSHPQSLKKQNPNFSFFSQNCLALDQLCKIKPQTAKMPSQTFINESDMLKALQIMDFQQKIIGLDFLYHRIVKS